MKLITLTMLVLAGCGSAPTISKLSPSSSSTTTPVSSSASNVNNACSGSEILGAWSGNITGGHDTLTFKSDCSGTSTVCQSNFTYTTVLGPIANEGNILFNAATSTQSGDCLTLGKSTCVYQITGNSLNYTCTLSNNVHLNVTYTKQ